MTTNQLAQQIKLKQSMLCVGLDVDLDLIPTHLKSVANPIFEFNKAIIDATVKFAVAYKPNIAFYEAYGLQGWEALKQTIDYLNVNYPDVFTIADAKRGDIGNTAKRYAKAFFEDLGFDAVTVAPYMGKDSVEPFLEFKKHHTIMLGLTSNSGAQDFQLSTNQNGQYLFEQVLERSKSWDNAEGLMYVVGATKPDYFKKIRAIIPHAFLLVPGIGAQGGSLEDVCKYAKAESNYGLLINSSRGIIYKSAGKDFAQAAATEAELLQQQMANYI